MNRNEAESILKRFIEAFVQKETGDLAFVSCNDTTHLYLKIATLQSALPQAHESVQEMVVRINAGGYDEAKVELLAAIEAFFNRVAEVEETSADELSQLDEVLRKVTAPGGEG